MIPEPEWLEADVLHLFHDRQVELFGGIRGIRDEGVIISSLNRPKFLYHYTEGVDLADLAATYLCALAQTQGYLDGNKRTAVAACLTFLDVNGKPLRVPHRHLYWVAMGAATNRFSREAVAEWIRRYVEPDPDRTIADRAVQRAVHHMDRVLDRLIRWSER